MTLFDTFFAVPHRIPGTPHFPTSFEGQGCWWDDSSAIALAAGRGFNVAAVGESQFQGEIAAIVGGRCEEGHNCQFPAELVDASDPLDPDAIGIRIGGRPVGRLPAELSSLVGERLHALGHSGKPITCKAKIVGGWDRGRRDKGYFGVKLSLALPPRPHPRAGGRNA